MFLIYFTLVVLQPCPNGETHEEEAKTHLRDYTYISYSQRMPHDPQGGAGKHCWGRGMSGLPCLACQHHDPTRIIGKKMDGWVDEIVLFSFLCSLCKREKARTGKQGDKRDWKQVDVRQLPAQSHIKRMLTSPLGCQHPFSI